MKKLMSSIATSCVAAIIVAVMFLAAMEPSSQILADAPIPSGGSKPYVYVCDDCTSSTTAGSGCGPQSDMNFNCADGDGYCFQCCCDYQYDPVEDDYAYFCTKNVCP